MSAVLAGGAAPSRVAVLRDGRAPLTHAALAALAQGLAAELQARGAVRETRIGILMPDGPDMALACLAATEAGICVPLNPGYPPAELADVFALTGVRMLVVHGLPAPIRAAAEAAGIAVLDLDGEGWDPHLSGAGVGDGAGAEPADDDLALLLLTSGSTARPKLVPLTHANLVASMGNLVRSLRLTADDRCLNMMPMFHVGGLIDLFLAPLSAGGSVVCAPAISAEAFFSALERDRPTWFQGVPTVLRDVLAHGETTGADLRATGLRFLRSVSAPIPRGLLARLEDAFGIPVIEIFGMTETSGLIASNPIPPGVRKPGSVGVSAGPDIRIVDTAGNAAAPGRTGEIAVRGPTVTRGYLNPELRREDFFLGDWLRTGDEGYLDVDGYLFITGRIKEIINRGGEKISPRQIDELVAEMAGIREAAAYATPHPTLGEEVALAVVPEPGATVTREEITAHLSQYLAAFKVPRSITFLDALPRVPSGKLDRKAIPASVEQVRSAAAQTPFRPPETRTEKLVARLWQKTLGVDRVGRDDDFFALGGDSLTATTFIIDLEAALGRTVPPAALFETPTLAGFAGAIDAPGKPGAVPAAPQDGLPRSLYHQVRQRVAGWKGGRHRPDALIVGRNTLGSRPPLFWGTTAENEFTQLARTLPDRPLYSMRSLSYMRGKSAPNMRLLGRHYAGEIADIQPEGPIFIGGFCEGGNIAFYAAQELIARGREVAGLLLQDRFVAEPFAAPVTFLWGRRTRWLNAFDTTVAERGWNRFYSGPLEVVAIDLAHEEMYEDAHIAAFAARVDAELRRLEAGSPPAYARRFPLAAPLPDDAYRARVVARPRRIGRQGQRFALPVTVHNTGGTTWAPTRESGIVLSASWRNFDGYPRVELDGHAELDRPVPPGGSFAATLELTVPRTGLPVILVVDLLEQGVGWFSDRGGRAVRTVVLPLGAPVPATA